MQAACDDLPVIEVAAGIIWRENTFLAAQRKKPGPFFDLWEFPGGKCEEGETPEEALNRELHEELGIKDLQCSLWQTIEHDYSELDYRVRLYFFHVRAFTGEARSRENQLLRWITPQEALRLQFLPADQCILTRLNALRLI
ncbi:MAG: (deoxy)nucleoside triphosphate pyrophosphohydrolase [Desulfovibrio sp.]|nr:(deoxy)nucleoside triphosphate pyrophosphohydrolase [Desulfovibrio sp.]